MNRTNVYREIGKRYTNLYRHVKHADSSFEANRLRNFEIEQLRNSFIGPINEYEKLKDDIFKKYSDLSIKFENEYEAARNDVINNFKNEIAEQSSFNQKDALSILSLSFDFNFQNEKDFENIGEDFGIIEECILSLSAFQKNKEML